MLQRQEPIRSLDELAAYRPPLQQRAPPAPLAARQPADSGASGPRVLVCHDMQGGYLDDAWIGGNSNDSAYRLFHWHLIDTFVYFSHHLVTVPPPGWVDCCHRHGVPCLGTFITEWEPGAEAMKRLLSSEEAALGWADRLAGLAEGAGFDGWLINVETAVEADSVPLLVAFLRRLRSHSRLVTVWYDSVISDGQLRWQNCLNELNERLFLAAGSMLLNYCWNPVLLQATASRLAELQKAASEGGGSDQLTVYVGVDCFGRGCPGGGGFNCGEALRLIAECGGRGVRDGAQLSVGLFAPGWAYETCPTEEGNPPHPPQWETLTDRAVEFWGRMTPWLGRPRPLLGRLNTSFCLGQGARRWDRGRLVAAGGGGGGGGGGSGGGGTWNNLAEAHPMPHYWLCGPARHLSLCRSRAWQGGGCLRVSLTAGPGGGLGGGPHCQELPLFRLSVPAGRVRALKLVYSLDSIFEDRPLDPVTVCLVAKYRSSEEGRRRLAVLCHSGESRLMTSAELAAVQAHYAESATATDDADAAGADLEVGGDCETLVFPRTVRQEVEGDSACESSCGGVVWHVVYTQARDPSAALDGGAEASIDGGGCSLVQICLFFILPSRLEPTEPINVYLGQVKVALTREAAAAADPASSQTR